MAGGPNTFLYALGDPLDLTDVFGLKTYQCKTPLHALTDKFGPTASRFARDWVPYAHHQYSCVVDSKGHVTCGGQDRSGSALSSDGKPSDDHLQPGMCTQSQPDNQCFESCLEGEWKKKRPHYGIPFGKDCQDYDDDVNRYCRKQCNLK